MFDLAAKRLVWIPVRWPGVTAEGDDIAKNVTHEIECQVEIVDAERLREIFGPIKTQTKARPTVAQAAEVERENIQRFQAVVNNWRKVKMGQASAPMTPENIALLIRAPMFLSGFERSYLDAWTGQLQAREGNSEGSSDNGPAGEPQGSGTAA